MEHHTAPEFKVFNDNCAMYDIFEKAKLEGYNLQYVPQIIDKKIQDTNNKDIWNGIYCTPGVRITGTTTIGKKVIVYAHIPNEYSDPENLKNVCENLKHGAGTYSQKGLEQLVDLADNKTVFVLDYDQVMDYYAKKGINSQGTISEIITIDQALKNPHTIPLIGPRAKEYFLLHKKIFGNKVEVYYTDDMDTIPRARLIAINLHGPGSFGGSSLKYSGSFLGKCDPKT